MKMVSDLLARIPPLFTDLAKILAGEIDCSHTTLARYGRDSSPYYILPQAVIYPKNTTDIKHVLGFAREYKMPITVRGGGRGNHGGALGEGIIIDMTRYFSRIRNVNMLENTITVDAGVTVGSLLEKLHAWNFDIPFFIGVDKDTTIGAMVATKSASGASFHHGTIREWIEGLTVVVDTGEEHHLADGITPSGRLLGIYQEVFPFLTQEASILRAARPLSYDDGTGYNLWNTSIGPRQLIDQLIGSEGTLGFITSITFRIAPYKTHLLTTCIPITNTKLIPTYIEIAQHHNAEHIFLYDKTFMELSERYHPTLVPFFIDTPYVLLVTHTSIDKENLHHGTQTFRRALPVEEHFLKTLTSRKTFERIVGQEFLFTLYSMYTSDAFTPITSGDGMIVTIHQLTSFLDELGGYLNTIGKPYTITGNVGSGHVSAITLFDPRSKNFDDDIFTYTKNIFSLLKKYDGGISAVGGDGLTRTPFLSYVYNDATLTIFRKLKELWDPFLILNPDKKQAVTITYLQQHIQRVSEE